jgi:hypothetical protein
VTKRASDAAPMTLSIQVNRRSEKRYGTAGGSPGGGPGEAGRGGTAGCAGTTAVGAAAASRRSEAAGSGWVTCRGAWGSGGRLTGAARSGVDSAEFDCASAAHVGHSAVP